MKSVDPFVYELEEFSLPSENFAKMFTAMNAEEKGFLENLKNSEAALRAEMEHMKQLLLQAGLDAAGGTTGFGKGGGKGNGDERGRALLN